MVVPRSLTCNALQVSCLILMQRATATAGRMTQRCERRLKPAPANLSFGSPPVGHAATLDAVGIVKGSPVSIGSAGSRDHSFHEPK